MASDGSDARPDAKPQGAPPHSVMDSCREVAQLLGIVAPVGASELEQIQWLKWWEASARAAQSMSAGDIATLKEGRWWPPLTAHQIDQTVPEIVRRTLRPGLFDVLTSDAQSLKQSESTGIGP
jgi:hypothetical protein